MKLINNIVFLSIILLSFNANAQWAALNNPSGALPFSLEIHNDTIYLGTVGNGIYRSTDGGNNWTQINNGITSMQIWTINHCGNTIFASSNGGMVYKSIDGGSNWILSNTGISSTAIVRKFVLAYGKIFATTTNNGVIISSDNGDTWTQHNAGIVGLVAEPLMAVQSDLFVGVNQKVYKYDSGNQNWIMQSNGLFNNTVGSLTYIDNNSQVTLFAATSNANDVSKSIDGGSNWTLADNGLPNVGVWSLLGINTTVFAGNDYGVYQTTNQGSNWTDISGFDVASPAKFLNSSSTDLYVIQGAKVWKKSLSSLGITGVNTELKNLKIGFYPNPVIDKIYFSNALQIKYYEIVDLTGRTVMSGNFNNESIELSGLHNGIYAIILTTADNKRIQHKIIKGL